MNRRSSPAESDGSRYGGDGYGGGNREEVEVRDLTEDREYERSTERCEAKTEPHRRKDRIEAVVDGWSDALGEKEKVET
ncbi:hypothetical protein L2E82_29972 [Cichorium intybus]|uniref:Uncharacterized protein n=1 Tax=Cichorium intybus TaxID=13427 RepID=A0ACB9CZH1_CICIN|nr:hypothetical protein L2E82_29972 [Cichorium intybus]